MAFSFYVVPAPLWANLKRLFCVWWVYIVRQEINLGGGIVGVEEIGSDEDLITPERRAKGDLEVAVNMRGKVSRAIPLNLTIIKELIRRRIFPYHYEIYGVGFLELRASFRARSSVRSSAVLLEQWGVGVSSGSASEVYQNVCRTMGTRRINIIQYVLEEMKEKERIDHHAYYKEAFECLISIMDEERERMYEKYDR